MSNTNDNSLGKVFKTLRIAHGLSVSDLAVEVGIPEAEVMEIESNNKAPGVYVMLRYCQVFNISKSTLLMFTGGDATRHYKPIQKIYNLLEELIAKYDIKGK